MRRQLKFSIKNPLSVHWPTLAEVRTMAFVHHVRERLHKVGPFPLSTTLTHTRQNLAPVLLITRAKF